MLLFQGCTPKDQSALTPKIGSERLSFILGRIQNVTKQKYALSTKDIIFPAAETSSIDSYVALSEYLSQKGYVVDIIANKYRTDLPKIIEVHEKGRYVGSMSTVEYFPLKGKQFSDVMLDFGMTTKYTVIMDEYVLSESKAIATPSDLFTGRTAADYLKFIETAYDYHVEIDQQAATVKVSKYKSEVINILADRERIAKDSAIFLALDMENKKARQVAFENGKIFITGTPSVIEKTKKYAEEINQINSNIQVVSFDGKKSVGDILKTLGAQKNNLIEVSGSDIVPSKDISSWFEKETDIDEYIRKHYNKKITLVSSVDKDADGMKDTFYYVIGDIKGVSIATPTTISIFFKKLGDIDGNYYMVDGDGNVPVGPMVIDDFEHLAAYMWTSSGTKLTMTDPGGGMPKIIRVETK